VAQTTTQMNFFYGPIHIQANNKSSQSSHNHHWHLLTVNVKKHLKNILFEIYCNINHTYLVKVALIIDNWEKR